MNYFEKEINKKYFNIGEVAKSLNVNTSLIRFWEEKFDILNPKKNQKGKRKFTLRLNSIIKRCREEGKWDLLSRLAYKYGIVITGDKYYDF